MAEISDRDLLILRRAQALADKLWDHPELGAAVQKIAKEQFPDAQIQTTAEKAEPFVAPLRAEIDTLKGDNKALLERVDKFLKEQSDRAQADSFDTMVASAVKKYGLTDEGKAKALQRMKDTGNFTDVEAAAAWVHGETPPQAAPTPAPNWLPQSANLFGSAEPDERFKALHKDPQKYMDDELRAFAKDPDGYVRETLGEAA